MMACTGLEFCKLAIVETKARGIALVDELERRIGDLDVPLTININGCPNACARTQIADIGLKGMIVTDATAQQVEGFQVHLGGGLGLDAGFGRKVRGHKVTGDDLADYVERVIKTFDAQREDRRAVRAVGRPRRRRGAGMSERASEHEREPGAGAVLPVLRRDEPVAARGLARRLELPGLQPGVRGAVHRHRRACRIPPPVTVRSRPESVTP